MTIRAMNKHVTRRTFLKTTGAVSAFVAFNTVFPPWALANIEPNSQPVRTAVLRLKIVAYLNTPGSPAQVRQALNDLQLRTKAENKIIALANGDPQTGVPDFDWKLNVDQGTNEIIVYPKLIITVDTTRTDQQLLNALNSYFEDVKSHLRALLVSFPGTSINHWHVHRADGDRDEVEL